MTQVMKMKIKRRKTSHTRRKMARRTSTRRRKMGRHTSSVIGSQTLIHLVAHPMMIVTTRRWPPLWLTLHHLDGLVVIGSLVIIRRSLWITQFKLWAVVGDSPWWSVEESTRRGHLILARIKGELHPCTGAPTRTSGEWRLSDTSAKHRRVSSHLFTLSSLILVLTFIELPC